jgi:hypothetical protein
VDAASGFEVIHVNQDCDFIGRNIARGGPNPRLSAFSAPHAQNPISGIQDHGISFDLPEGILVPIHADDARVILSPQFPKAARFIKRHVQSIAPDFGRIPGIIKECDGGAASAFDQAHDG